MDLDCAARVALPGARRIMAAEPDDASAAWLTAGLRGAGLGRKGNFHGAKALQCRVLAAGLNFFENRIAYNYPGLAHSV